jgi:ferredoxin/conjugal transfer/entry exclusion protein
VEKAMKRIIVSDQCVACGVCVVNSEFLMETDEGYAVAKEPGLMTAEQSIAFQSVIDECPVGAISVEDELISTLDGSDALIELKRLMNEKIKNYRIPYPASEEVDFVDREYEAPPLLKRGLSQQTYRSYDRANSEGFYAFKNSMYTQQTALIQAVCVEYKTRQLKKFAYYKEEIGNYYYDINSEVASMLEEAVALGQAISGNQLNLPADFCSIKLGPDYGFDGGNYCYVLRNVEQLDWSAQMKDEDFYRTYINVEDYGDEYKYSLDEVEETFREYIVFGLYLQLSKPIDDAIESTYKKYNELFKKLLNEKLALLKTELKKCASLEEDGQDSQQALVHDITMLINELKAIELQPMEVYHYIDQSYDSSFRFSSYSDASEAATNRTDRFYNSCSNYLNSSYGTRISVELASKYQAQFEGLLNGFKTKLQELYDKHDRAYPDLTLRVVGDKQMIAVKLDSYDDVSSNIDWDIRKFIDEKVLNWGGVLKTSDYFTYSDVDYDINESITWKQGWFGEKEVPIYNYLASFGSCQSGFNKAVNFCCDYVFNSDYIHTMRGSILSSLEQEINSKLLAPLLQQQ